ncbi:MAG: pseudoazurin [Pseudomonadota bacterium]
MIKLNRRTVLTVSTAALMTAPMRGLLADSHGGNVIEMLTKHPETKERNVFAPRILSVNAGEAILFKAVEKGHNSASIDGMIPDGAEEWNGKIGRDIEVSFEQPGIYGFKCTPHAALGMVGLVVVQGEGMFDNLEAAQSVKQRGKAKKVFEEIWEQAAAEGLLSA